MSSFGERLTGLTNEREAEILDKGLKRLGTDQDQAQIEGNMLLAGAIEKAKTQAQQRLLRVAAEIQAEDGNL